MNKRKYQWPIYETWIVTSKPSRSFNFILGYKEVVFTLGFLRQDAHCYAKKCYASGKQLTPGLIPQTWSRLHVDGSYKNKDLPQSRRQSYHKSFINLPFEWGVGGGGLFISSTFEEGWGSMKLVIICIRRSKSNPNSRRLTILGQSTLA